MRSGGPPNMGTSTCASGRIVAGAGAAAAVSAGAAPAEADPRAVVAAAIANARLNLRRAGDIRGTAEPLVQLGELVTLTARPVLGGCLRSCAGRLGRFRRSGFAGRSGVVALVVVTPSAGPDRHRAGRAPRGPSCAGGSGWW